MSKYYQGTYQVMNADKYVGTKDPVYRSSWELGFMAACDKDPRIEKWGSECVRIPYRNPFTGKPAQYIPDFLVVYVNKANQRIAEVIEIKPSKQVTLESAKSPRDKAAAVLNKVKWDAARVFCQQRGLKFRIVTERDLYITGR